MRTGTVTENEGLSMYEEQMSARGRKVQRKGPYRGLHPDGQPWPEVLIGAKEIGGYLRLHPVTVRRMMRDGRLPAQKDSRKRWMTTKSILEKWMLQVMKLQKMKRDQRRAQGQSWSPPRAGLKPSDSVPASGMKGANRKVCPHCKGWGEITTKIGVEPTPCPHCEGGHRHVQGSATVHPNHTPQLEPERRG